MTWPIDRHPDNLDPDTLRFVADLLSQRALVGIDVASRQPDSRRGRKKRARLGHSAAAAISIAEQLRDLADDIASPAEALR